MPTDTTKKKSYDILRNDHPHRPDTGEDVILYSFHPHTPIDMIYYKIIDKDLVCICAGADVEDHIEPIRQKLKKCLF